MSISYSSQREDRFDRQEILSNSFHMASDRLMSPLNSTLKGRFFGMSKCKQ
ncbi:unnamed protein product [Haemonchus placei]|uniref:Uncharacterized protein n=1 Tax=Haemonchus placei TaxID=6290 RepID=A0A3P7SJN0_HAEPC|nr:unnamed protein product [Haemonchus placei]